MKRWYAGVIAVAGGLALLGVAWGLGHPHASSRTAPVMVVVGRVPITQAEVTRLAAWLRRQPTASPRGVPPAQAAQEALIQGALFATLATQHHWALTAPPSLRAPDWPAAYMTWLATAQQVVSRGVLGPPPAGHALVRWALQHRAWVDQVAPGLLPPGGAGPLPALVPHLVALWTAWQWTHGGTARLVHWEHAIPERRLGAAPPSGS